MDGSPLDEPGSGAKSSPGDDLPRAGSAPAGDDLAVLVDLELRLLDPRVRADPTAVEQLLDPAFVEFGSSGRVWDRHAIIAALADDAHVTSRVSDLRPVALAPDVVLLTYRTTGDPGSLRSSVWVKTGHGWRLRFHQGTPAAAT